MARGYILALMATVAVGCAAPVPTPTSPPPPTAPLGAPTTWVENHVPPDTREGEALFLGCAHCHRIEGVADGVGGPDLTHIGTDAASRTPGMPAAEYIVESIKAHKTPRSLTAEQVDELVRFLEEQE